MADETSKISSAANSQSTPASGALTGKRTNEQIDKNQFLELLVTQLKNQDPLDPMNSDQFAVNLAQFSQLEQLMSINEKIGVQDTTTSDLSSLPSYLGREVKLSSTTVQVQKGSAGQVSVDLETAVDNLQIELRDANNRLVDVKNFDELAAGKHTLVLDKLQASNGEYKFNAVARTRSGAKLTPEASITGLITGFVPGPDPKLLMGNMEVPLDKIVEVRIPESQSEA